MQDSYETSYAGNAARTTVDPFTQSSGLSSGLLNAIFATALFRCWHLILFFTGWATMVVLVSEHVHNLSFASTLLTVFGTVLGFVISYRTTASFERYNEGRRYWSAVVYGSRLFGRTIWFHIPDAALPADATPEQRSESRSRSLIEKKSAINLIEAFAVSLKHYLRGEDSIYYEDLYHLVKFLPAYALPAGRPSTNFNRESGNSIEGRDQSQLGRTQSRPSTRFASPPPSPNKTRKMAQAQAQQASIPEDIPTLNMTSATPPESQSRAMSVDVEKGLSDQNNNNNMLSPNGRKSTQSVRSGGFTKLMPAYNPPEYALFDVFPFSMFVKFLSKRGKHVKGKKGAKVRARDGTVNHNIPLELTLYMSAYISTLQQRKICDVPTINTLMAALNMLCDSLTGLERILTTPIPFSYSIHLWTVTTIYVALLPFQLFSTMKYLTIPFTSLAAFIFYGFIVAGEEIENPFGYDKNDLNLDHFTHHIIRAELNALTSRPMPNISDWAFTPENSEVFAGHGLGQSGVTPKEWVGRGEKVLREVLARADR
ncbi:hypothetical protein FRB94_009970 [Tulasnella sp. JGI-2019a]|nr:hypothetical protein FRB93_006444 [Tulasnella sp. JGI-2019a]KAG8994289.1 hypothetical protein FRB94_009970 [Tulasnella sp. JGI-2019a]KAG9026776.1 hypothetical protein FRB95_008485 [Tulasnella sp. JGI-2019a]